MAFKDSFRLLFGYLRNNLNAFVEDIELGSLSITVKCSSLQILKGLWEIISVVNLIEWFKKRW